jgi:2-keto-3-deoxy-6-phosphogluconate aldolase
MTPEEKAERIIRSMEAWQRAYAQWLIDAGTVLPNEAKEHYDAKTRKTD